MLRRSGRGRRPLRSAEAILGLDVPDLDLPGKCGRVISKARNVRLVRWQTGTAMLLPRLLAGGAKARSS